MDIRAVFFLSLMHSIFRTSAAAYHFQSSPCDETPYPQVCESFLLTTPNNKHMIMRTTTTSNDQQFSSSSLNTSFSQSRGLEYFNNLALSLTLNQALETHTLMITKMDLTAFDPRARMAWDDCLELYNDTIELLNQTITLHSTQNTIVDHHRIPTYLSAAITNHETCNDGFAEVNVSFPLNSLTTNFSKMLSNTLALHTSSSQGRTHGRRLFADGFPVWVSGEIRRLLKNDKSIVVGSAPRSIKGGVDFVVAKDGSGDYATIMEAIAAAMKLRKQGTERRLVIHVRGGVYEENVEIKRKMTNLMLVGDGMDLTVVTGKKSVAGGFTTFRSATFAVMGDGFVARDMTFENTAGPQNGQAVALRSGSDFSLFHRCSFKGYQDTLYVYSKRQFYRDCHIYGTVDFIFGDAAAVFQNCNIYVRQPLSGQKNTVTAQARSDPNENTGIVIHNSRITSALERLSVDFYLGRPWKKYSRTVVMKTFIDGMVSPLGWTPWSGGFGLDTLYYGEYMNVGPGSNTARRVEWPGFHVITNATEAEKFTAGKIVAGNEWIPATGAPYLGGL